MRIYREYVRYVRIWICDVKNCGSACTINTSTHREFFNLEDFHKALRNMDWIRDSGSGIRDPGSEIRDPVFGIRYSGFGIRYSGFGIRDSGSGIRDPEKDYSDSRIWIQGLKKHRIPDPQNYALYCITWTSKFSIFMAWRLRDLARLSSAFTYLLFRLTAWSQSAITSSKFLKKNQTESKFTNASKDTNFF